MVVLNVGLSMWLLLLLYSMVAIFKELVPCSEDLTCRSLKTHCLKSESVNYAIFTYSTSLRAFPNLRGEEIDITFQ